MMRQLRQNTKIILWIVVVAFITTIFAVWGMDLKTGSPGSDPSLLGKVNGIPITRAHYRSVYEQLTAEYRKLSPSGQLTYTQMELVDDQVWDIKVDMHDFIYTYPPWWGTVEREYTVFVAGHSS